MNPRHARHALLPEVGSDGVARLAAARVLLVGAGGLGSAALPYLVGAGIGRVTLLDPDVVEITNLHRQVIYREADVGARKAHAAAARMRDLDAGVVVEPHALRLDAECVDAFVADADVVIDATDDAETKLLLGDACVRARRPLVYASVSAFDAVVAVFAPGGPCLRCLHPRLGEGLLGCAVLGVLGPLVGMVGALQATEAIKVLLATPALPPLVGRIWLHDARDASTRVLALPRRSGCAGCAGATRSAAPTVAPGRAAAAESRRGPTAPSPHPPESVPAAPRPAEREAAPATLVAEPRAGDAAEVLYVDLRDAHERRVAIPGALHVPFARLLAGGVPLPSDRRLILYCSHGQRSRVALAYLRRAGFPDATHLEGGVGAYGGPLERVS